MCSSSSCNFQQPSFVLPFVRSVSWSVVQRTECRPIHTLVSCVSCSSCSMIPARSAAATRCASRVSCASRIAVRTSPSSSATVARSGDAAVLTARRICAGVTDGTTFGGGGGFGNGGVCVPHSETWHRNRICLSSVTTREKKYSTTELRLLGSGKPPCCTPLRVSMPCVCMCVRMHVCMDTYARTHVQLAN